MDIVYPVKRSESNEELRHSLRSLSNLKHDKVWMVGYKPSWVTNVEEIPLRQIDGEKYKNLCGNIRAACINPNISDPFIMFNDDFFVLRRTRRVEPFWREKISEAVERYEQRRAMRKWAHDMKRAGELLQDEGVSSSVSYELHIPIVVHKQYMLEALDLFDNTPVWRTLYGNLAGLDGERYRSVFGVPDAKRPKTLPSDRDRYVSSSDVRFAKKELGGWIRDKFSEPCRYEK